MKFHCCARGIEIIGSIGDHHAVDMSYLEKYINGRVEPLKNEKEEIIGIVVVPND